MVIGFIGYLIGCFFATLAITMIVWLLRPFKKKEQPNSAKFILGCYLFLALTPYLWSEALTLLYGKEMQAPVEKTVDALRLKAGLKYYRVVFVTKERARVVAVGEDKAEWGGTERVVIGISLYRDGNRWVAGSYNWISSLNQNADSTSLPPYW